MPCRLITRTGDYPAWLVDLSTIGARVYIAAEASVRGEAVLQWNGVEAFAAIVWSRAGYAGLAFYSPLPETWVLAARGLASLGDGGQQLKSDAVQTWKKGLRRL